MSMQLGFDCRSTPPADPNRFEPLPAGWYLAAIIASEEKIAKSSPGARYLALTFQILDGPAPNCKNRQVFCNLNLINNNATTVQIAQEQLSAIGYATGNIQIPDSSVLHNKPLLIKLTVKPQDGQYPASNEVKGFKSRDEHAPQPGAGVGGNTVGVPDWGQNQPQAQQQQPTYATQQPAHTPPAAAFGNVPAAQPQPSVATRPEPAAQQQPAGFGAPQWAQPRK